MGLATPLKPPLTSQDLSQHFPLKITSQLAHELNLKVKPHCNAHNTCTWRVSGGTNESRNMVQKLRVRFHVHFSESRNSLLLSLRQRR